MTPSPELRRAILVFAAAKVLVVTALLAGRSLNFLPLHPWNYLVYTDEQAGLLLAFINWDGQHYLKLALGGYPVPAGPSSAFYPLFPATLALAMLFGLGPIAAGLVVVTLASAMVFFLLQKLLPADEEGPSSLWLLAAFPSAFYLSVVYAEALFLAAFLGLVWALREPRHAAYAALCAALLPLTRGQGLWLALPLAAAWIFHAGSRRSLAAASAGWALGVVLYLGFFWWRYGDPFAGFVAQKVFVFENAIPNLLDLERFADFLLRPPGRFLDTANSGLDKLMIVVSLAALGLGIRRSRDAFLATAWLCFALLPAMMGQGGSYARHALLAWTCFVVANGPALRPALKWALIVAGFGLQLYLAWCFGGNRWVG
jgi:hypothetical protein